MGKVKKVDDVKEEIKDEEMQEEKENEEFIMSVGDDDEVINEVEGDVE